MYSIMFNSDSKSEVWLIVIHLLEHIIKHWLTTNGWEQLTQLNNYPQSGYFIAN